MDGFVRAYGPDHEPGWFSTESPSTFLPLNLDYVNWSLVLGPDQYMSLSPGKSAPWLFFDRPDDSDLSVLWDLYTEAPEELQVIDFNDSGTLLVNDPNADQAWHVQPSGVTTRLTLDPPEDRWLLRDDCGGPKGGVDDQGQVILTTRHQSDARVYRLEPETQRWQPIGLPMTAISSTLVQGRDETYIVRSSLAGSPSCPAIEWDPSDALVYGSATQVARPDNGVVHLLPEGASGVVVGGQGHCVAYANGDQVEVLDVLTGQVQRLDIVGAPTWVDAP